MSNTVNGCKNIKLFQQSKLQPKKSFIIKKSISSQVYDIIYFLSIKSVLYNFWPDIWNPSWFSHFIFPQCSSMFQ